MIMNSIPSSWQAEDEIIYRLNDFNFQKKSIITKKNHCVPSFTTIKYSKQNVGKDNEIKSGLNILKSIIPKQEEETSSINNEQNDNINSPLNLDNNKENYLYNIKFKINLLESKKDSSNIFGDSRRNSEFENQFYSKNINNKYNDQIFDEIPIISKIFTEKNKMPKNFINFNLFFENNVYRPKVYKKTDFKNIFIIEKVVPYVNEKPESTFNHYSKLNFNVPENFLINFNIKNIYSENIPLRENNLVMKQINLNNMKTYINNICSTISKSHLDFSIGDYIELKKADNGQSKNAAFLQRKRQNSSIINEDEKTDHFSEEINPKGGRRRKPLKKNHKNNNKKLTLKKKQLIKNNNKKNGPKISLYLNQIQINKNRLEQFPFCQLLNAQENIKIDLLKGIIEKKELIKIKRKPEIINHQNNLKYIVNKKFEIIYQKNEDDTQYILCINGINILYLILYYYYQIKEEVKLINKNHYSHASYEKSNKVKKDIENLIKKCNKITKEITKEEHYY